MERNAFLQLKTWKDKKNRKPLLLTGVRQCGKTFLVKDFAKQEFTDFAYFNFDGNEGLHSVFDYDFDVKRILDELGTVVSQKKIIPGTTWFFLMRFRTALGQYRH